MKEFVLCVSNIIPDVNGVQHMKGGPRETSSLNN